jgi:hypothetical protein
MVMIGIDPHKRTHTAVAVDEREMVIGERLVHARVWVPKTHPGR